MAIELTEEQKIVETFPERTLIIKGAAGSRKTLVGLHRAYHMVKDANANLFESKKVIFLTFNNSLINDLKDKYETYFGKKASENIIFKTYNGLLYMLFRSMFLKKNRDYK